MLSILELTFGGLVSIHATDKMLSQIKEFRGEISSSIPYPDRPFSTNGSVHRTVLMPDCQTLLLFYYHIGAVKKSHG